MNINNNSDKKYVLISLPSDILGGAEQYLKMIASYFQKKGFIVHVFFLKYKHGTSWDDIVAENLHLHFTKSRSESMGLIPLFFNLFKIRRIEFEYVFTSHVHITAFISMLNRIGVVKKKQFIARESTSVFIRYKGSALFFHKLLYKVGYNTNLDLLICQTDFMYDQLLDGLPYLSKQVKICVLPNPIDLKSLQRCPDKAIDLNLEPNNYLVAAGRLIPEKGFDLLIIAFKELHTLYPKLKLIILGVGKERDSLISQIDKLKLRSSIILPGFTKDVLAYFKYARACVVSSRIEGFPNVLLQMMSQNTKVISTKCAGGIVELDGVFTAEVNNIESLKNAIHNALSEDTTHNRTLFDDILTSRDINEFVNNLNTLLWRN